MSQDLKTAPSLTTKSSDGKKLIPIQVLTLELMKNSLKKHRQRHRAREEFSEQVRKETAQETVISTIS